MVYESDRRAFQLRMKANLNVYEQFLTRKVKRPSDAVYFHWSTYQYRV